MIIETDIYDLKEAQEKVGDLLREINREGGYDNGKELTYLISTLRLCEVADSFKETGSTPVTPFDIPIKTDDCTLYYSLRGFDEDAEPINGKINFKGAVGYIEKKPPHKNLFPDDPEFSRGINEGKPYYRIVILRPEEVDPMNFTLPFRGLPEEKLFIFALMGVRFYKPIRPLSIEEALTTEGQRVMRDYYDRSGEFRDMLYWSEDIDEERYINRTHDKKTLFQVEDDEAEENPDLYPDTYKSNIVLLEAPTPSLLSRATGKRVDSAKSYANAIEQIIGTSLDERECSATMRSYNFHTTELFLDYALYEFTRTENYSHLAEILSHYSDFGLSSNWEKDCILLLEWHRGKFVRLSPEEYVLSKYLKHEWSNMIAPLSFRELAQATGTPIGIITKAAKYRIWD